MDSRQQALISGETVYRRIRLHWLVLFWPAAITTLLGWLGVVFLLGTATPGGSFAGSLILAAIGLSFLFATILGAAITLETFESAEAILTNKRILVVYGIFRTRSMSILFATIENTTVQRGSLGKALDCGTVVVHQCGGAMKRLRNISHPLQFQRYLQEQLEKTKFM